MALLATATGTGRDEGEGHDVDDLLNERRDLQPHESSVCGNHRDDRHADAVWHDRQLWLITDRECTDHRNQAGHERTLLTVEHARTLTVEERDFRSTHDVAAAVTLSRIDEEESFDVAEDGKADVQTGVGIEPTEVRHTHRERTLTERDVLVRSERVGGSQAQDGTALFVAVPIGELARGRSGEEIACGLRTGLSSLSSLTTLLLTLLLCLAGDHRAERRNWSQSAALARLTALATCLTTTSRAVDQIRTTQVVLDVEAEVDTDAFKERIRHRDEADFDRHLQVLQAAELFQQIADFIVDLLRLANDQAQGGVVSLALAAAAHFQPRTRFAGRRDQIDEFTEIMTVVVRRLIPLR